MKTTAPLTMIWRMMRQGGWWYVINLTVIVVLLLVELLPGLINRQVLNDLQSGQQLSIPWLMPCTSRSRTTCPSSGCWPPQQQANMCCVKSRWGFRKPKSAA